MLFFFINKYERSLIEQWAECFIKIKPVLHCTRTDMGTLENEKNVITFTIFFFEKIINNRTKFFMLILSFEKLHKCH